ncbi:chaperonin 10-like protein [Aspergillus insuetus]
MVAANLTLPTTMRALLLSGVYNVTVQNIPVPQLLFPTDAIVKLTSSASCGSDLFAYRGFAPEQPAYVPGHEGIGHVAQVGSAVTSLSVGDYVITAEYERVPAANANLIPLPIPLNETTPTLENSFMTIGDIFSTGWTVVMWSGFQPGDSVAVFGAGPVGLMAAYSALPRGASRVYSVDHILAHELEGVHRAVDCVGMKGLNAQLQFEPSIVTRQMINVTGFEGGIGQIGVYDYVPGFPISDFWVKVLKYQANLVNLVASRRDGPKYYERSNRTEELKVFISFT